MISNHVFDVKEEERRGGREEEKREGKERRRGEGKICRNKTSK
jgi:hypothetical protein